MDRRPWIQALLIFVARLLHWIEVGSALAIIAVMGIGCGSNSTIAVPPPSVPAVVTVNSLEDTPQPVAGSVTLREALDQANSGQSIVFAPALNGGTIELSIIGEAHTVLKAETYSGMTFAGYAERDYGKSALYAQKNVVLDASGLTSGITIRWTGGEANPARVLAVYGDLTIKNVIISGGYALAEATGVDAQPYTLARGGGLAVWGTATLQDCTVSGNRIAADLNGTRDRGAYGGGVYANGLKLTNCVVSGNSATGYGAAGGGVYSVGGADNSGGLGNNTSLSECSVSGNRVTAQHAYGGGIFTLSGGPANLATMTVTNCTVARNLVEHNPDLQPIGPHYYRGGGIYVGGGSLSVVSSTIVENEVTGYAAMISGKPNMGGGGIAATIGNAHVVEDVRVRHSIIAGNKLSGTPQDVFTGSLLNFYSGGYNLFGVMDFSQILAPVPDWRDLNRKHYPKIGDRDGVLFADIVSTGGIEYRDSIQSAGTDVGQAAVLWYPPIGVAVDQIPSQTYTVTSVKTGYTGYGGNNDDFLNHLLAKLRNDYGEELGSDFGNDFGDLTGVTWYGPAVSWPSDPANVPWINFWKDLDSKIGNRMGTVTLGDEFWGTFSSGPMGNVVMVMDSVTETTQVVGVDQRGHSRSTATMSDIGAIEK